MCKLKLVLALVAVALLAPGCATIAKGTNQAVTLHTDPEGATCDVVRESTTVASLSATPGQVTVEKAQGSLDISCRKAGHQPTELRVDSQVQGWTFGNIVMGGIIGLAVDAATGAIREYPQFITLTLVPEEFASSDDRERYVKERLARFDVEAAKASQLVDDNCKSAAAVVGSDVSRGGHALNAQIADACEADRKALLEAKERRAALLRERVGKARVRSEVAVAAPPIDPSTPGR